MHVVKDTIGDMEGLHSKLDRKSHVEDNNLTAAAQLQSKVHSEIDTLSLNMQGYSEAQLQACNNFSGGIGSQHPCTCCRLQAYRPFFSSVDDWASSSSKEIHGIKDVVGDIIVSMQQFSQSQQERCKVRIADLCNCVGMTLMCAWYYSKMQLPLWTACQS